MGLGSTAKKLQTVADRAEQLYAQLDNVREQLTDLRAKVEEIHTTVTTLETKHQQNRALLEALADERGIDVEEVLTEAAINDAEDTPTAEAETAESAAGPTDADAPTESEAN